MTTIKVKSKDLPAAIARVIRERLNNTVVASILVDRAKLRIRRGGDTLTKSKGLWEPLWATRTKIGPRAGGDPLRDTGRLSRMLSVKTSVTPRGVRWTLLDGTGYGVKHQEGFINQAPIAVPLNAGAKRVIPSESPHNIEDLESRGLRRAKTMKQAREGGKKYDFYVIENDATVPARPIANNPPEDIRAISEVIKDAIKGV